MPNIFSEPVIFQEQVIFNGGFVPAIERDDIAQEANARFKVPLTNLRVWDAMQTNLPGTAAADDLALIGGTFGTASPVIQTSDGKATTLTQRARFLFSLPHNYDTGQSVTLRLRCGMVTTVADNGAATTVDVECYRSNDEGGIGTDICTTNAVTINSLTDSDKDFTINPATLNPGDTLDVRITVVVTDAATGTAVIGQVGGIEFLLDVKG